MLCALFLTNASLCHSSACVCLLPWQIDLSDLSAVINSKQDATRNASKATTAAAAARARARQQQQKGIDGGGGASLARRAAQAAAPGGRTDSVPADAPSANSNSVLGLLGISGSGRNSRAERGGGMGGKLREGGRYYPRPSDRSVPQWGDSPPREASSMDGLGVRDASGPESSSFMQQSGTEVMTPKLPLPASIDSAKLGHTEECLSAPTIPLAKSTVAQGAAMRSSALGCGAGLLTSSASAVSLPSMFAADLEGPAELVTQPWEWVFTHLARKSAGTTLPSLPLQIADTVLLSPTTELTTWLFTSRDGTVRRKNSDKLTPANVREAFERASLRFAAFNTQSLTTVVRRSGAGAQILDDAAMRDLTKDSGDLSGIVALQLYMHPKGGNGTRYVCEYELDRATLRIRTSFHKRVYLGSNGIESNRYGAAPEGQSGNAPQAYPIACNARAINENLAEKTRLLADRLQVRALHASGGKCMREVHAAARHSRPPHVLCPFLCLLNR